MGTTGDEARHAWNESRMSCRQAFGTDVFQHLADPLQAQIGITVQHELVERIHGIGDLAVDHAVTAPPEFLPEVLPAPFQQVGAGLQDLRLRLFDPLPVPRIAVVFPDGPEDGAGFDRVAEIVDDPPVFLLRGKEVLQAAARLVRQAHGFVELDDGCAFRADRRIDAHVGSQCPLVAVAEGDQVQVKQSGLQHVVDPFLGDVDLCSRIQLVLPEGLALYVKVFVGPLGKRFGPVGADGPVGKDVIHVQGLARLEEHRRLFVRNGPPADAADAEDAAVLERGEAGGGVVGVFAAGEGGVGDLHPGVARDGSRVGDGRMDDQDGLFLRRGRRREDFFQLLPLRFRPDPSAGIAVRDHEVRSLDVFLDEDGFLQRHEALRPVDDVIVRHFRKVDGQDTVLQAPHDVVVCPHAAAEAVVVDDLMGGDARIDECAAGHRRNDPLVGLVGGQGVRKLFADFEPADVPADAQPDRSAHLPGDLFRRFERSLLGLLDPVHLGNEMAGPDERHRLVIGQGDAVRQHHDPELRDPDRGGRVDVAQEEGEGFRAVDDRDDGGLRTRGGDGVPDFAADPYAGRLPCLDDAAFDAAFALEEGYARHRAVFGVDDDFAGQGFPFDLEGVQPDREQECQQQAVQESEPFHVRCIKSIRSRAAAAPGWRP